jgi:hypothetical protein
VGLARRQYFAVLKRKGYTKWQLSIREELSPPTKGARDPLETATPEGSTPPSIFANDYLMLPTLLFFVILADGGSTKYYGVE